MRKIAILGLAAVMALGISTSAFAAAPFEGKQTVSALLDQDWNSVEVTIDLSDGWSAEFAQGAVYLYDGPASSKNDSVAMGFTLDGTVYRDYVSATDSPEYKEEKGIVSYKEEDGTRDYFFEVEVDRFEPAHFMITVDKGVDGDAVFNRFDVKGVGPSNTIFDESDLFTEEDLDSAIDTILEEFNTWNGCELQSIDYAGDEFSSSEALDQINKDHPGNDYTDCIQFRMDFHSPCEEEDLDGTAWIPDTDYLQYEWTLARKDGGEWEIINHGY